MQSRKRKGNNHCVQLFLLPAQLQTLLIAFKRMKQLSTHQHLKIATYFYTHWKCQLHNRVQLCDPMGCSLPGSSVHGILQARILQWFAIPFSRGSFRPRDQTHVSYVSCTGRQVLYTSATWEAPDTYTTMYKIASQWKVLYSRGSSAQGSLMTYRNGMGAQQGEDIRMLVAQSCPTLWDPRDYSLPGSSVHRILLAKYWCVQPFSPRGDLPNPGIEPVSLALWADSSPSESGGKTSYIYIQIHIADPLCYTAETNTNL